ncbi:MAG: Clp protease N-terminal domain-containing protein [bacterium]|nr:Clp protease N-terminal domain-containing protein [bacterium]
MAEPRFTDQCEEVFRIAKEEARGMKHPVVTSGHILLAILLENYGLASYVLKKNGFKKEIIRLALRVLIPQYHGCLSDDIPWSDGAQEITKLAPEISRQLNYSHISTEHLLLAALWDSNNTRRNMYHVYHIFALFEITPREIKNLLLNLSGFCKL